jgi:hypothetical protein
LHALVLVASHCTHLPAAHAGVAAGHGTDAPDPKSPLHATHLFVVVSHALVAPVHAVAFVAEHCMHEPLTQAGSPVVGQLLPAAQLPPFGTE